MSELSDLEKLALELQTPRTPQTKRQLERNKNFKNYSHAGFNAGRRRSQLRHHSKKPVTLPKIEVSR